MTFELDTSGVVALTRSYPPGRTVIEHHWSDLSPFTQGYVEALFISICPEEDGSREMRTPRFDDLAPETLARIIADCEEFADAPGRRGVPMTAAAGMVFWRARSLDACGGRFGPLTVQLCDEGKVRFAS